MSRKKPSRRSQESLLPPSLVTRRGRVRIPSAPASAPWRAILARTAKARAELDARAAGAELGRGPAMVLARTGRAPSDEERRRLSPSLLHID